MPVHRRVLSKDEELGKRNNDFRPKKASSMPSSITQPWRWRKRRVVLVLVAVVLIYFFIQYIPTDFGTIDEPLGLPLRPGRVVHGAQELREPAGAPPRDNDDIDDGVPDKHYYNGPIKFYRLAGSLRGIWKMQGAKPVNRNILFAASSLKSVANLMPMACDMGRWERNYVHVALFGRDTLSLEDILEVNGVSKDSCTVYFHDARGDYAEYSSDSRLEASVRGAMKHVNDFMHPQAIITDDSAVEDSGFTIAMRAMAKTMRRALIEIPDGRYEDWLWMTRLDSASLANWFRPTVDVLVQAPTGSSGGLIRLVKSLETADYSGLRPPKLTIELPSDIEYFAKRHLERLVWPPDKDVSPLRTDGLVLRHRIPSSRVLSEQASLRFLESFYPTSTEDSHVLILSPQVELSPLYLQYLQYAILEYRYSSYDSLQAREDLLGISLDVPTSFLNGTSGFIAPNAADMTNYTTDGEEATDKTPAPFMYQAASSTASLIFGDNWVTLHSFLSNRMAASHASKVERPRKLISETEPAWLEYLLELMRARGWSMLHPAVPLLTVHNELFQIPEEYMQGNVGSEKAADVHVPSHDLLEEPFLRAQDAPSIRPHAERAPDSDVTPLQDILPFEGDLPQLSHIPYMYHTGDLISAGEKAEFRDRYAAHFRRHVGGCEGADADRKRRTYALSADDLFCLPGTEAEYDEGDDEDKDEEEVAEAIVKATEPAADDSSAQSRGSPDVSDADGNQPERATVETKEEVRAEEEAAGG